MALLANTSCLVYMILVFANKPWSVCRASSKQHPGRIERYHTTT